MVPRRWLGKKEARMGFLLLTGLLCSSILRFGIAEKVIGNDY
jgi:hypothetical protein